MNGRIDRGLGMMAGVTFGVLVGAGVALLMTPATGPETRRKVADMARRLASGLGGVIEQTKGLLGGVISKDNTNQPSGAWETTSKAGY